MSDPAAEAADRAVDSEPDATDYTYGDVVAAAREALKPIRSRHYPVELAHSLTGRHKTVCAHCHQRGFFTLEREHGDWPCADAKDAYTTEELS